MGKEASQTILCAQSGSQDCQALAKHEKNNTSKPCKTWIVKVPIANSNGHA